MPRAPRTTDPPASPATALIDDESLRSLGDADGRVIVIDGVRVVANHHRSSSWMDDAETKDDATTLRRSRSAGSDARSDHRGWFAKALARTFSSTMRIEEEAEREEGGVGTASVRRD